MAWLTVLAIVATVGLVAWYRVTYQLWPGQALTSQIHWCGRDYEHINGGTRTWAQISATAPVPIRFVGQYPPLGPRQELFAALTPPEQRFSVDPPLPCAMALYVRTGPDRYLAYTLLGGP